jgi:hypothetical protein
MTDLPMKDFDEPLDDEMRAALDDPDLDLITDYVGGELEPAQVDAVLRRLETDAQFREFAAPILAAWQVAPRSQRMLHPSETQVAHPPALVPRALHRGAGSACPYL